MTAFEIIFTSSAEKEIRRLPNSIIARVANRIDLISSNPFTIEHQKLFGHENMFRCRVGDYRIVYTIDLKSKTITVERIRHRKDIYRKI
jgi:mRNA interferase RelE/StbE